MSHKKIVRAIGCASIAGFAGASIFTFIMWATVSFPRNAWADEVATSSDTTIAISTDSGATASTTTTTLPCADGHTLSLDEANAAVRTSVLILDVPDHLTGKGGVTNGTGCSVPITVVSFTLNNPPDMRYQTFLDKDSKDVPAGATLPFQVKVPSCNFQIDYYYGFDVPNPDLDIFNHDHIANYLDRTITDIVGEGGHSCDTATSTATTTGPGSPTGPATSTASTTPPGGGGTDATTTATTTPPTDTPFGTGGGGGDVVTGGGGGGGGSIGSYGSGGASAPQGQVLGTSTYAFPNTGFGPEPEGIPIFRISLLSFILGLISYGIVKIYVAQ